ncbi:hypothetical protein [Streptomyces ziwulingensis]|uniref:Uncharacterized protein n=1 Tax=Streptomyces ziwulingensis TaxID=1045501 RepID=A0ABP9BVM3_9ACTN
MTVMAHFASPTPSKPWAEPSAEADSAGAEAPLTSEPPLPDAEPLTSESPFADAVALTSESSPELTADTPDQGGPSFAFPEQTGP